MFSIKIDVKLINKDYLFRGEKGTYLDAICVDKPNTYGDDGYIAQGLPKELREANPSLKGPIIGNWRNREAKAKPKPAPYKAPPATDDSDIPW